jgi:hypothetical protein
MWVQIPQRLLNDNIVKGEQYRMLTKEQLKHRTWLAETEKELQILRTQLNNDTNAVISSLINGCASKLLAK